MVTIAVDAMGGDHAPKNEILGVIEAVKAYDVRVKLIGRKELLESELDRHSSWRSLPIEIVHASEHITMDDSAAKAVRGKKDSSIRVASRLVRDGEAAGVVSAGNTGAVMATAKMVQGMVHGVERPALAAVFPTRTGKPAVVVDVGANVDSTPQMLAQFAVMGEVYSRVICHTDNPRVGLLSIGEEEHKGNELTKAATPLIKALPINFIGNVEGRDIFRGHADVVVCDGFIGNVLLKTGEGVASMITGMLRETLSSSPLYKAGAFLAKGAFAQLKKQIDYSEYGGAPLLGVKGVCIICHGSSNPNAIKNAVRVAAEFAASNANTRIEEELMSGSSAQ
ncbi:MAG: phosphate acyltransferase PlsX [Bryobacteraceae bacterium]